MPPETSPPIIALRTDPSTEDVYTGLMEGKAGDRQQAAGVTAVTAEVGDGTTAAIGAPAQRCGAAGCSLSGEAAGDWISQ